MSDNSPAPEPELGERTLILMGMHGGLIATAELAVKMGEILCEAHYGKEGLATLKPLFAVDNGSYWRVEGSLNRDGKVQGYGNFYLSIDKYDGRVTDIGCWMRYGPEGDEYLRQLAAAKTLEERNALIVRRSAVLEEREKKKNK